MASSNSVPNSADDEPGDEDGRHEADPTSGLNRDSRANPPGRCCSDGAVEVGDKPASPFPRGRRAASAENRTSEEEVELSRTY